MIPPVPGESAIAACRRFTARGRSCAWSAATNPAKLSASTLRGSRARISLTRATAFCQSPRRSSTAARSRIRRSASWRSAGVAPLLFQLAAREGELHLVRVVGGGPGDRLDGVDHLLRVGQLPLVAQELGGAQTGLEVERVALGDAAVALHRAGLVVLRRQRGA